MNISTNGIKFLKEREGEILHGYLDSVGLLTIGVGHLVQKSEPYKLNGKITTEESTRLLKADLARFEKCLNNFIHVPVNQNQYDALLSLAFNIGEKAFTGSTVLRKLNAKDYAGAKEHFLDWKKAGGKVSKGLIARRKLEQKLFGE